MNIGKKDYEMSDCEELGLSGLPIVVEADRTDGRYSLKSLSMLVRDADGEVIVGDNSMFTARRLLSEQYEDIDLVVVAFVINTSYQSVLRYSEDLDQLASTLRKDTPHRLEYGLACINGTSLTIPQREAAEVIVRIASNYLPPIERDDSYVFPTVLDALAKDDDGISRRCLPWKSFTESKAYEVAEAISRLYSVNTRVIEDGGDYYVSADHGEKLAANMNRIAAQMKLLQAFDLRSSRVTSHMLEQMNSDGLEAVDVRATRAFIVEDGINAILAHLGHPVADVSQAAPVSSKKPVRGRRLDASTLPPDSTVFNPSIGESCVRRKTKKAKMGA